MRVLSGAAVVEALTAHALKRRQSLGPLRLCVVLVGDNAPSAVYVRRKQERCAAFDISVSIVPFAASVTQQQLLDAIAALNADDDCTAILIQLPLPDHINERVILDAVQPSKDVDALGSAALTDILLGQEQFLPCTPQAVLAILDHYKIPVTGRDVCVVGVGLTVGSPLALALLNRRATVTVCHSRTKDLGAHTRAADIIISAVGVPHLIRPEHVREGAVVIDVGMQFVNGKLVGDIDPAVASVCEALTPVPGGVGPVTVHQLVENMLTIAERSTK